MITYELQEARGTRGVHRADEVRDIRSARSVRGRAGRAPVPAARVRCSGRPPVARPGPDRSASALPVRTRTTTSPAAMCPSPVAVAPRGGVAPGVFRLRRIVAGVGLAVASAAAVVGLGLLADASSTANADPVAPAVVQQGS